MITATFFLSLYSSLRAFFSLLFGGYEHEVSRTSEQSHSPVLRSLPFTSGSGSRYGGHYVLSQAAGYHLRLQKSIG